MPIYNFGLEGLLGLGLYISGCLAVLLSLFWKPKIGLYFLIPLLPLQTIRYRMNEYPLGESMVSLVILAVAFGSFRKHQPVFRETPWGKLLAIYCGYTLLSFFLGTLYLQGSILLLGRHSFRRNRVSLFRLARLHANASTAVFGSLACDL